MYCIDEYIQRWPGGPGWAAAEHWAWPYFIFYFIAKVRRLGTRPSGIAPGAGRRSACRFLLAFYFFSGRFFRPGCAGKRKIFMSYFESFFTFFEFLSRGPAGEIDYG